VRALLHVVAVLVGAGVSVASVAVHRVEAVGLPVGLLLAVAATFAVVWAMWQVRDARRLPTSYALGWLVPFGHLLAGRPEGDFVVVAGLTGYVLMLTAILLLCVGVAAVARPRGPRAVGGRP